MASPGEDPFEIDNGNYPPDDFLSEEILDGVQAVRKYLDRHFWRGDKIQPGWKHLKMALRCEDNKPMLKLLITWGASATEDELAQFRVTAKDKYRGYIKLLRQCGLPLSATAMEDIPYAEPEAPQPDAGLIPEEWKKVLRAAQDQGAGEAVIAGGALRDLFNNRAIKDVDIFLKSRGDREKNREFLRYVFNRSGLWVEEQPDYSGSYPCGNTFPDPKSDKLSIKHEGKLGPMITGEGRVESWKVIAGDKNTEYNVVFVDNVKFINKESGHYVPVDFDKTLLINGFDLGLCQIAYDGKEIIRTYAYDNDVKYQQIILQNPNDASKEHLQRIAKKYPDWELCEKSRKLLARKPPPSDAWMMYSWSGWR